MTKYFIKKIIIYILGLFVILNIIVYGSFYITFVTNAPKELKEARFNFVTAHFISFYEIYPIDKKLIDYQNPILKPLRKLKLYFYQKGIKKLSKDESERAIWFGLIQFTPFFKDMINKNTIKAFNQYGREITLAKVEQTRINIELLSKYDLLDVENKRIRERAFPLFFKFYRFYIFNFFEQRKNMSFLEQSLMDIKNEEKINNLKQVYLMRLNFFNKKVYQKEKKRDFKKYPILKQRLKIADHLALSIILENALITKGFIPKSVEYKIFIKHLISLEKEFKKNKDKKLFKKLFKTYKKIFINLNKKDIYE